jgi:signal transduction histidine kinase
VKLYAGWAGLEEEKITCHTLRHTAVVKTPLGELLAQLTEAITSRSGLPILLYIEQFMPLQDEVQTSFYRIAQESLNNIVKHAQANQVTLSLSTTPLTPNSSGQMRHEIKMEIKDDGVGFASGAVSSDRLGIGIMRERAEAIQADFSLESQPGHGTSVTVIYRTEPRDQQ